VFGAIKYLQKLPINIAKSQPLPPWYISNELVCHGSKESIFQLFLDIHKTDNPKLYLNEKNLENWF
jgi:hypothetical protein